LIADPYQYGGGLHATSVGGKLAVHADYNRHPTLRLDRRLNLLLYLNEGWSNDNGGQLELWNHLMTECVLSTLPLFNRTVIFSTTKTSYHGQPEPIHGPEEMQRKSIALYYFTNGRPEEGQDLNSPSEEHSTLWMQRPNSGF